MTVSRGQPTTEKMEERVRRLVTCVKDYAPQVVMKYLDFGCGNGRVALAVCQAVRPRRSHGHDLHRRRKPTGDFDLVTCFDVLEHTRPGEDIVAEIADFLAPGGLLIATVPNRWWIFETHARPPFNRLPFFNWGPWRHLLTRRVGRNVPAYTASEAVAAFNRCGIRVVDHFYMGAPMDMFPPLRGRLPLSTRWPCLAVDIVIVARRAE